MMGEIAKKGEGNHYNVKQFHSGVLIGGKIHLTGGRRNLV